MPLKVIGAGFGRTGTASLKTALEMLGFGPCYHMMEVFQHPEHVPLWQSVVDGNLADLDPILAGYNSTCDWPTCSYYEAQMQANPDAKIILTVRDPETWYESAQATIFPATTSTQPQTDPVRAGQSRFANQLIWHGHFSGRFGDKAHAIGVFNQHVETVKRRVPADKLLVFDVKEGWEPLCAFLDVPVPDAPFPRTNDRAEFIARRSAPPPEAQA
jgi:hypothetical protein